MSNSSLVDYTKWSPNNSGARKQAIDIITIHMVVGQCAVETLGEVFANPSRQASSNYGIGYDGRVGQYVDEANRAWTSSSSWNDNRAVTIETASDTYYPYAVNDIAYMSLLALCTDICQRNGKNKLLWYPTYDEFISHYQEDPDAMYMTLHRWFAATSCPGQYLEERMSDISSNVTKLLKTFTDVTPDMSAYRAIEWMAGQGYVQGYKDGTFRPDQPLTRAQLCVIMWRMAGRP